MAALWRDNYGFRVCGALWLVQWDPLEDRRHAPSSRWNLLVMCRRKMWSSPRAAGWITSCTVSPRFYQMYSFLWLAWDHSTTRPAKKRLCPIPRVSRQALWAPAGWETLWSCISGIWAMESIWGVSWSQLQTQIVREQDFNIVEPMHLKQKTDHRQQEKYATEYFWI